MAARRYAAARSTRIRHSAAVMSADGRDRPPTAAGFRCLPRRISCSAMIAPPVRQLGCLLARLARRPGGHDGSIRWSSAGAKASGDPRKSLVERYKDHDGFVKALTKAA